MSNISLIDGHIDNAEHCVCCGAVIPEGRQVCIICGLKTNYKQSTTDVVQVRHGEWLYHECVSSYDGAISGYSCSHCGVFVDEEEFENDKFHKKFCGNCGAKMDGKDGE